MKLGETLGSYLQDNNIAFNEAVQLDIMPLDVYEDQHPSSFEGSSNVGSEGSEEEDDDDDDDSDEGRPPCNPYKPDDHGDDKTDSASPPVLSEDPASSSTDAVPFVFVSEKDNTEDEIEENIAKLLENATTKDDFESLQKLLKGKLLSYMKAYKECDTKVMNFTAEERKKKSAQARAEKTQKAKEDKREAREAEFVLIIRIASGKAHAITVRGSMTVKGLLDKISSDIFPSATKKSMKGAKLLKGTKVLTESNRKTLVSLGLCDGDLLDFQAQGAGGAGKRRVGEKEA